MITEVINTIKKYNLIENGDRLVLGVSGGPDSMAMLDILNKINNDECIELSFNIVVAHVNHLIREEAKEDEEYVRNYCKNHNIDFYSKSIDVRKFANTYKMGTEEAGRNVRYEFFEYIRKKTNSNKIGIAHNKNDNAETIIMNVVRGSGLGGLKGIEAKRDIFIRPLIECERDLIERYCQDAELHPRIDKTNFQNEYTRNKIRNIVIPYIKKEFNPNIVNTIFRMSELVKEEEQFIEKHVIKAYSDLLLEEREKEIVLDLKKFNKQEIVIKSRVVLYTISRIFGSSQGIEKIHIEDILKLCSNNIGNKYLIPNKKIKILVKNSKIFFISQV